MASKSSYEEPLLGEASFHTLNWARLKEKDEDERRKLLQAGQDQGFFYLDLSSDKTFVQDWKAVLDIMTQYFHLDTEEKMRDSRNSDTHGYEPVATSSGAVKELPDYYESLKASREEVLEKSSALAPVITANHSLFLRFSNAAHEVVMTILRQFDLALSEAFGMQTNLASFHQDNHPSLTTLAMFRYPKQETPSVGIGHGKHTDLGTLTFLLCQQWGLQVLSRDPAGWQFVAPKPNHAVINVGDTLCFLSGRRLRSAVHRVIPTRGLQHEDRSSIAYFLRAKNEVEFEDSTGRTVSAKAWHDEKFDVFREPHEQQERVPILTGGMERGESLIVT